MNKRFKLITIVLLASVMTSVVTGCGNTKKTSTEEKQAPKDLTFTWWGRNFGSGELANAGEAACIKEIEKKTGVKIQWQHPAAGTNENEQLNLIIASNQLPDLIFANWSSLPGGMSKYIGSKSIISLNTYIDKYAPNYKKALEKYPEAKKQAKLDDGTLPAFFTLNGFTSATSGLVMRQDWLTKLNLKAPTTMDEWYTTLKAIKDGDPNGNGKKDEIPWSEYKDSSMWQRFAPAYGFVNSMYKDPTTGKAAYGPLNPQYKEFISTMAKWYKEGLIDQEFASNDKKSFEAKIQGNIAGASYLAVGGGIGIYTAAARAKTPSFTLQPLENIKGANGKTYGIADLTSAVGGYSLAITNACKYPVEAVKMCDFFYSEEGQDLIGWGIEGKSYTIINGKKQFTDAILKDPSGKSPVQAGLHYAFPTYGFPPRVMEFEPYSQINLTLPEQKLSNDIWSKPDTNLYLPPVQFTTEESANVATIMNDVGTYKSEMELKFIMGAEPLTKIDEFVNKLKSMHIQEAIDIYQKAYDRYNARK
jgi:putative aldouronate transport system substrate-binding protein